VIDDPAYLLRFQYLESIVEGDPHLLADPAAIAALRGLSAEEYGALRGDLSGELAQAVAELGDEAWTRRLDALPWQGKTVVAVGDSITADLQSWARILAAALGRREAHAGTRMLDLAVDGDTSAGLLSRLPAIAEHQPDHVLIMVGTNDGQGHAGNRIPWISDRETERNLEAIGSALRDSGSEVAWIAPPPIRIEDIERHWYLGELPIGWSLERHESKRQIVLSQDGFAYDPAAALGQRAEDFLDGLHPSLEGHLRLARGLVEGLSSISS
jgi:acyl-CoA thioesterase-1